MTDADAIQLKEPTMPHEESDPMTNAPQPLEDSTLQSAMKNPEPERLVPVSESIRYRKRAQAAERQTQALQERVNEMTGTLAENEQALASMERRQRIDALLSDADTMDLEAARLLTEAAVAQMDQPDVDFAVADLRRHKPYLFRAKHRTASAMGAEPQEAAPLDDAAEQAVASGNRRDLLRYLRLRRGTA